MPRFLLSIVSIFFIIILGTAFALTCFKCKMKFVMKKDSDFGRPCLKRDTCKSDFCFFFFHQNVDSELRANATSEMGCMTSSRALQRFYSDLNGKFNQAYTPDPLGQRLICNSSDFCNGKMTSATTKNYYDATIFLTVVTVNLYFGLH